ncbi:hypothetical protein M4D76_24615 [Peribacillus frigoritolerans]|uniref:hypothetical protein n=1 Tax=Peribacillus frigoritolerans TaxID=450367 RepID=UPI0021A667E8|nr:hypothetical protein [Peribacillus frigoritolerans]MCT1391449.1 hypothetical protein [Peribacillus frigoritolerans]
MNSSFINKRKLGVKILTILPVFIILFQRISFTFGSITISAIFIITYIGLTLLISFNGLKVGTLKFLIYIIMMVFLGFVSLFKLEYSPMSYLYLVLIYLPFIFVVKQFNHYVNMLYRVQCITTVLAMIGIFQFVAQFIGLGFIDPISLLPENLLQSGYSSTGEISYGSGIYRSNGFFFLEASFFSQFLALSIIIEMLYFKKLKRVLLYLIALFTTFSGTGLILLLIFLLPILIKQGIKKIVIFTILFLILILLFLSSEFSTLLTSRIYEITGQSQSNSGFIRFVGPIILVSQIFYDNMNAILWGLGPGNSDGLWKYSNNPPLIKVLLEYGIFSSFLFLSFIFIVFKNSNGKPALKGSLIIIYMLLSGSLLQPQIVFFILFLSCIYPPVITEKEVRI